MRMVFYATMVLAEILTGVAVYEGFGGEHPGVFVLAYTLNSIAWYVIGGLMNGAFSAKEQ